MLKLLGSYIHQSWLIVVLCIGIIVGVILGLILRVNYFVSGWWIVLAIGLLIVAYVWPRVVFVIVTFIAGIILAFFRTSVELVAERYQSNTEIVIANSIEDKSGTHELVNSAREWFAERIRSVIPDTEANLGLSYLLGVKTGLPKEFNDKLRAVGLTHIVVASGAHLSILVEVARKIFGKVSRFSGLLFSVLFVLFFMCMVGWTPSILRAGLMSILTLLAWYVGREFVAWRIILLVVAITLMMNPTFVMNLGWQLSFASYAGIMMLGPKMVKYFYGKKKPGLVTETILATISATLMTLPLTLYYFGQISLISIGANLLILPTLPYAMGLVFMSGIMAKILIIGDVVAWYTIKLLDYHIWVVDLFGGWTHFLVKIPQYQLWVFCFYVPIAIGLLVSKMVKFQKARYKIK